MTMPDLLPVALAAVGGWLLLAGLSLLRPQDLRWVAYRVFPSGALIALVLGVVGLLGLTAPPAELTLPLLGLPGWSLQWRLDALSGFFLILLGAASFGVSVFSCGYFRSGEGTSPGVLGMQYHVFLAGIALVLLAADAYSFMLGWELMTLASYFLVLSQHRQAEIRSAAYLYLLLAHLGALALMSCFALLAVDGPQGLSFAVMRQAHWTPAWASAAFVLALLGFGVKGGLVPLHVWLPQAHPAAPSPVSALMSGVMLKTALYGLLRVSFDLLHAPLWWWGLPLLGLGLFSALYGVLFAAVQTDMKRLLAYSSIENLGIAFAALGLALVFHGVGMNQLAALALAALLIHALNHALFKTLLFLATGSVLHATGQRNLGRLGGLLRRMPWVGWCALIGALALAGLPPLNGFIAEWLLIQAFLFTPSVQLPFFNLFVPLGGAALVLTTALAAYVMVKFYGVVFLGRAREASLEQASDPGWAERFGLLWLAAACVLLGMLPGFLLRLSASVSTLLLGITPAATATSLLWLVPLTPQRSSYAPVLIALCGAIAILVTAWLSHRLFPARTRRADLWDCGSPTLTPRMQDSAEGFGQPVRRLFEAFFRTRVELPHPDDSAPRYAVEVEDRSWQLFYAPVRDMLQWLLRVYAHWTRRTIALDLGLMFATLLLLLALRWGSS